MVSIARCKDAQSDHELTIILKSLAHIVGPEQQGGGGDKINNNLAHPAAAGLA